MITLTAKESLPNTGGWKDRHNAAVTAPTREERAVLDLIEAWRRYADAYRAKFEGPIGEDGYCGDYWQQIGYALNNLLSADLGRRLDGGWTAERYPRTFTRWQRQTGSKGNSNVYPQDPRRVQHRRALRLRLGNRLL